MKFRHLALAVAVLAVLSAIAWLLQRPSAPAKQDLRIGQSLFDTKMLEKTGRLRLADQGKTVVLTRQADGKWIDSSYFDLPADFSKLSRFTDDLANAKVQRLVTRNPERLFRLEFKDTSIALLDSADKELWRLTLGKNAEGGGRFVKFGDEASGYLANLSIFLDAEAKNWADSLLIDLKPDDVAQVEVGFAEGEPVTATRAKKEDGWTAAKAPAGQRLKSDRITSLLSSFTNLRFQDTSDLGDANVAAARQHSRTLRLTTFDHKAITIQLGRKPEEKKPEVSSQLGAPKPAGEGGKTEVNPQKPEASGQNASENAGPKTQDPELKTQNAESAAALAAAAPETGGPPAVPKPEGGGGKTEVSSQTSEVSSSSPTQNSSPAAEAGNQTSAQNSKPQPQNAPATPEAAKPAEPKVETIPAGPVYAFITSSDPAAPINALMKKRAYQIYDWNFTSLPQKPDELFEPVPPPPPAEKKPEAKPAETKPSEPAPGTKPVESKPAQPTAQTNPAESPAPEAKPATAPAKP